MSLRRPVRAVAPMVSVAVAGLLVGCGGGDDELLVFAAASVGDVAVELAERYEAEHPGVEVVVTVAGSATLREQVRAGAPASVFWSANADVVDDLADGGFVDGEATPVAANGLVVAVPAGNPAGVSDLGDLARADLTIGWCAAGVPCGDLARLVAAAAELDVAADTETSNVRALLTQLRADELDAALVYRTDVVAAGDDVVVVDPLEGSPTTAVTIAALDGGPDDLTGHRDAFIALVAGSDGRAVLDAAGFGAP